MKERRRIPVYISAEALEKSGRDFFSDAITKKLGSHGIVVKGREIRDETTGAVYSLSRSALVWRSRQLAGEHLAPILFFSGKKTLLMNADEIIKSLATHLADAFKPLLKEVVMEVLEERDADPNLRLPESVSKEEVARLFGTSERTVYQWTREGFLPPPYRVAKKAAYPREAVVRLLKNEDFRRSRKIAK